MSSQDNKHTESPPPPEPTAPLADASIVTPINLSAETASRVVTTTLPDTLGVHTLGGALLVVVDAENHRLQLVDMTSNSIYDSVDLGSGFWYGLCVCRPHQSFSEDMLLAVSDLSSQTVKIFNMRSKRLMRSIGLGSWGSAPGQLNDPYFLCMYYPSFAGAGACLLVSNQGGDRIDMFDFETGIYIRSIGEGFGSGEGQMQSPCAIAVWTPQEDPSNAQLVVADCTNSRLQFFRLTDGMYVRSMGEAGTGPGQIKSPWAMAIHSPPEGRDEDALLVTIGYRDGRVHVFHLVSGVYLRCLTEIGVVDPVPGVFGIAFHRPAGEAETATQVIISNFHENSLQVLYLYTGAPVCCVGGGDSGLFKSPCCVSMIYNDDNWDYFLK